MRLIPPNKDDIFDNVSGHIDTLGDVYLARIAGTPASTGPSNKGFAMGGEDA